MTRIYMSAPDVGPLEEGLIVQALRSGWVAPAGPDLVEFEKRLSEQTGRRFGVAVGSGTAALHLGLLALGIGPGQIVITSSFTFAATANAIVYTGATPVFVDSLESTGNLDPELLRQALAEARHRGDRVGAILPVDLLGRAADHTAIAEIAAEFDVPVLNDAAESLGARHRGTPAAAFGRAAAVSFNGNKIMTTSGGGMLLTDERELADRVRYLATQARMPVRHYEHTEIGYNYRLSNLLAALGLGQLERLPDMMARRRAIRERYRGLAEGLPGVSIFQGEGDSEDNCWLTAFVVDPEAAGWTSDDLIDHLESLDIESRPLWKPMHLQPVFQDARSLVTGVSESLFRRGVTLPSGSVLRDGDIDRVVDAISAFADSRR